MHIHSTDRYTSLRRGGAFYAFVNSSDRPFCTDSTHIDAVSGQCAVLNALPALPFSPFCVHKCCRWTVWIFRVQFVCAFSDFSNLPRNDHKLCIPSYTTSLATEFNAFIKYLYGNTVRVTYVLVALVDHFVVLQLGKLLERPSAMVAQKRFLLVVYGHVGDDTNFKLKY